MRTCKSWSSRSILNQKSTVIPLINFADDKKAVSIESFSTTSQCQLVAYNLRFLPNLSSLNALSSKPLSSKPLSSKSNVTLSAKPTYPALSSNNQAGFTLVEITVVVVIIAIFAGMISLSVGSSESRKNRAFYEHLTDSLSYVRLLSAERMQPMGLRLQPDQKGQITPVIVALSNPYSRYQTSSTPTAGNNGKNAMELSADISSSSNQSTPTPSWDLEPQVTLPELPVGVSLNIQSLETAGSNDMGTAADRVLQPWFTAQSVPQVLWFGTGQATPVTIEVLHNSRLVGEVITILPDGSMTTGQGSQ